MASPLETDSKIAPRVTNRTLKRGAIALGFSVIALQRFGVGPAGTSASVTLPMVILVITALWAVWWTPLKLQATQILLYCFLVASTALVTAVSFLARDTGSLTSFALFLLIYSLVLFCRTGRDPIGVGRFFFSGAVTAIKLGSILAIIQYFGQRAGLGFFDPLTNVSEQFLVGGYNTYWDLRNQGGIGQFKPNGVIFLEPSFLSLYSAIALVYVATNVFSAKAIGSRRSNIASLLILTGGFIVSASASGLVVLGVAAIPLILGIKRNRILLTIVLLASVLALLLGTFNAIIEKAMEGFDGQTSSALRLTLPYKYLTPYWLERPILGWGPGEATNIVEATGVMWGLQPSTLMKLLAEYGLVGAIALALAISISLRKNGAPLQLSLSIFAAWAVPAEALLNTSVVMLLLFAISNWLPTSERAISRRWGIDIDGGASGKISGRDKSNHRE